MNLAAPIGQVPLYYFAPSVFIGLIPYHWSECWNVDCVENYVANCCDVTFVVTVTAGTFLSDLTSASDVLDVWTVLKLCFLAVAALAPVIVKRLARSRVPDVQSKRSEE